MAQTCSEDNDQGFLKKSLGSDQHYKQLLGSTIGWYCATVRLASYWPTGLAGSKTTLLESLD